MLLLIGLSTILTIYIGGIEAISGNISTGNIAEFIIYVNMLTWPMASIGWVTSIIQRAAASQKRINEFLKYKSKIDLHKGFNHNINGKIVFKNINFKYPDGKLNTLKNISFEINKGQKVAIVGRTGSGKSTLINLISRMYNPSSGTIKIDDIPIGNIKISNLRSQISLVTQETLLFSDTISNNIAFGSKNKNLNKDEIVIAAKKACIHENITNFPNNYETIIGERGVTLSGGQKQRISIARALVKSSSILIFDDCLSAVDNETENKIFQSINKEIQTKTSITISHRLSSIKDSDKIIVLEKGKIAEIGNHKELLNKKEIYYEMWKQQIL